MEEKSKPLKKKEEPTRARRGFAAGEGRYLDVPVALYDKHDWNKEEKQIKPVRKETRDERRSCAGQHHSIAI